MSERAQPSRAHGGTAADAASFVLAALAMLAALGAAGCSDADDDAGADVAADAIDTDDAGADSGGPDAGIDAADDDADDTATATDTATDADTSDEDTDDADNSGLLPCPGSPGCPCDADTPCLADDDACTVDPVCDEGFCTGPEPADCKDANGCTVDSCDSALGCVHTPSGKPCEDGDLCTYADVCKGDACVAGVALGCDDGDVCTDDACIGALGCQFVHNTAVCWDGNACVADSVCGLGTCNPGKLAACNDGNACTVDRCNPEDGCVSKPWPVVSACADGAGHGPWCYEAKAYPDGISWLQAREACSAAGALLAPLPNAPAEATARAVAATACGEQNAWVGLDDRIRDGVWRWSDGGGLGWQNWNGGEPNNAGGEDVVELVFGAGWNDVKADQKRHCVLCARRLAVPCSGGSCTEPGVCGDGACDLAGGATATTPPAPLPKPATLDCDDHDPCTSDGCGKAGCTHVALADGVSCTTDGGVCAAASCVMPTPLGAPPSSCAAILAANPAAPSGLYVLGGDGASWTTHCEMGADGGGWTAVLKVKGDDDAFAWGGEGYKATAPLEAEKMGKEAVSARGLGYAQLAFTAVRLVLVTDTSERSVVLPLAGASLHGLINAGKAAPTALGYEAFTALVPKGSLQKSCHKEGALAGEKGARVVLGIVGNNENDCATSDSWIGVGGTPNSCGKTGIVAGNVACYGASAKVSALGRVYVR